MVLQDGKSHGGQSPLAKEVARGECLQDPGLREEPLPVFMAGTPECPRTQKNNLARRTPPNQDQPNGQVYSAQSFKYIGTLKARIGLGGYNYDKTLKKQKDYLTKFRLRNEPLGFHSMWGSLNPKPYPLPRPPPTRNHQSLGCPLRWAQRVDLLHRQHAMMQRCPKQHNARASALSHV